jgi:hypothetical protein
MGGLARSSPAHWRRDPAMKRQLQDSKPRAKKWNPEEVAPHRQGPNRGVPGGGRRTRDRRHVEPEPHENVNVI